MRVSFERTGGFANVPLRAVIDSDEMPPKRSEELKKLVERALPFDHSPQPPPRMPDQFQYDVTVEDKGRTQKLTITDDAASDDLKELFDFLGEEALNKVKNRGI